MDVQDIINENLEKQKKKKERLGITAEDRTISNAANSNAKNIKSNPAKINTSSIDYEEEKQEAKTYKAGSIAERANMVKQYNEKNAKK